MSQSLPQNPQTLGDIVGLSVRMVRRNAGLILRTLLFPSIASCACITCSRVIALHWMLAPSLDLTYAFAHIGAMVLLLVIFAYFQWDLVVRGLALTRFCVGYANSYKEALEQTNRRWLTLALISTRVVVLPAAILSFILLIALASLLVSQLSEYFLLERIVLAVLLSLSVIAAVIWSGFKGSMLLCVFACEDVSVRQMIQRSDHLTQINLRRGGMFLCLMGLILVILVVALNMPLLMVAMFAQAFSTLSQRPIFPNVELPIYIEIAAACWGGILNLILLAVALVGDVLYYRDVRIRLEGIDIKERLMRMI